MWCDDKPTGWERNGGAEIPGELFAASTAGAEGDIQCGVLYDERVTTLIVPART